MVKFGVLDLRVFEGIGYLLVNTIYWEFSEMFFLIFKLLNFECWMR